MLYNDQYIWWIFPYELSALRKKYIFVVVIRLKTLPTFIFLLDIDNIFRVRNGVTSAKAKSTNWF